jgi:glycerophosphoryl diester phosphodiesterase
MKSNMILLSLFLLSRSVFAQEVNYFGHRGCRGILPENSIESFKKAIELGVDGVELDVVVNKDGQLVISHEPYFKSEFCLDSTGNNITAEKLYNIYHLSQEEILKFDCGSIGNPKFPNQKKIKTSKPLLQEFFSEVDLKGKTLLLEVKSEKKEYGISQPEPTDFAKLVIKETAPFQTNSHILFMSFDAQILEEIHKIDPQLNLIYLTYKPAKSAKSFLKEISFNPYGLGMYYPTISKRKVHQLKKKGIYTFAWTVNDNQLSNKLINKGVNGIITDYPDRVKSADN